MVSESDNTAQGTLYIHNFNIVFVAFGLSAFIGQNKVLWLVLTIHGIQYEETTYCIASNQSPYLLVGDSSNVQHIPYHSEVSVSTMLIQV